MNQLHEALYIAEHNKCGNDQNLRQIISNLRLMLKIFSSADVLGAVNGALDYLDKHATKAELMPGDCPKYDHNRYSHDSRKCTVCGKRKNVKMMIAVDVRHGPKQDQTSYKCVDCDSVIGLTLKREMM